ncbi:MAG TPA: heavy metal translocating P-type ATPase, partial [Nitrososphaerales archaeon]|nr:heavy metal translocating P-type ATPase [Nitrososphaerales archaeon]
MAKDPVCGMSVAEGPGSLKATVKGTTFYFCSEACRLEYTMPQKELSRLRALVAAGSALTVLILLLTWVPLLPPQTSSYALLVLAIPVQFVIGSRFYRGTYQAIRARSANMDVLVVVGTTVAFGYSTVATVLPGYFGAQGLYFDASAVIMTLVLAGRLLEHYTKERATDSVRKLLELTPRFAHLVKEGHTVDVPVEDLNSGDLVEVKPGERIPTDGTVESGTSDVDESLLTGEGAPVAKARGSPVIGGSFTSGGRIFVRCTAVGQDTVLGQIQTLVEQAKAGKAPIQMTADTISRYFVPSILVVALSAGVAWRIAWGVMVSTSVLVFVSVVIIACPCALGIATPAALLAGTGSAAKRGILMKGGEAVESAARVDTVILDKTGTVTEGKQSVIQVLGDDKENLLSMAASVERGSEHTIGRAILQEAEAQGLKPPGVANFASFPGLGVKGEVDGNEVRVGRREFAGPPSGWEYEDAGKTLQEDGNTVVFVRAGSIYGAIAVGDRVKPDAPEAIRELRAMGLSVLMLTGDDGATAKAVAQKIGVEDYRAGLLPIDKEKEVEKLQAAKKSVAVIGDGVNDAPALARADLGVAIGSGTDVAKETGGIVLIGDRLTDAVDA